MAQLQEIRWIPLATKLNNTGKRHLIDDSETPYLKNMEMREGELVKRLGLSNIHDFNDEGTNARIIGFHRANANYAIVCVGFNDAGHSGGGGADGTCKIYEWNYVSESVNVESASVDPTIDATMDFRVLADFTTSFDPTGFDASAGVGASGAYTQFNFANHYDYGTGKMFTVMTNGIDEVVGYDHTLRVINEAAFTPYGPSGAGNPIKGLYLSSFYDALYIANITDAGDGPATVDQFGVSWSQPGVAQNHSDSDNTMQRPESGSDIVGLVPWKNNLILCKFGDYGELWAGKAYANFERIMENVGPSNMGGIISSGEKFWFSDRGRIIDIKGNWMSYPIHEMIASQSPGGDWDVWGAANDYNSKFLFSAGTRMFTYSFVNQGWTMSQFNSKIRVLGNSTPGQPLSNWIGIMGKHTPLTIAQEDTIADYYIRYNNSILAQQNHFSQDDSGNIECEYQTKTISGDTTMKQRWQSIVVHGGPSQGPFTLEGYFHDSPTQSPTWVSLGSLTLNADGFGEKWINQRSKWAALRIIENNDSTSVNIYKLGLKYTQHTYR